jgi:NAD(P)-dependent dehydrogenase (short-subunit alcohol dehydrogenase family)
MGLFDGKVAIVTGAGRGIGRAEALLLAAEGAAVVVNDLGGASTGEGADRGPAQLVVDEIVAAGGRAAANVDSVADWKGGRQLVAQAVDEFGGLDVLVNNAGILRDKMSFNMDEAEWDSVIAVHLTGHFVTSRFASAYWRQRSKETGGPVGAAIVNTASESGLYGNAGQVNYAAAKAGLIGASKALALEVAKRGVTVNVVAPGFVETEILEGVDREKILPTIPLRRLGRPEEVAAAVVFLCSEGAAYITGAVINVNGGAYT